MDIKQIKNMKHCIGITKDKIKHRKFKVVTNQFVSIEADRHWESLVHRGYAVREFFGNEEDGYTQGYMVTKRGTEVLGNLLECEIELN